MFKSPEVREAVITGGIVTVFIAIIGYLVTPAAGAIGLCTGIALCLVNRRERPFRPSGQGRNGGGWNEREWRPDMFAHARNVSARSVPWACVGLTPRRPDVRSASRGCVTPA